MYEDYVKLRERGTECACVCRLSEAMKKRDTVGGCVWTEYVCLDYVKGRERTECVYRHCEGKR